ncbi:MAG TPA: M56 family metallopeptidase [Candidatus Kapabacteria bacterium]|nr:M56 family metallopeptidase [Candidatus Kapabacteria bacterium]
MGDAWTVCGAGLEILRPLILDATIKGTVLVSLAAVIVLICKRSAAAVRHQVWFIAIAGALALPVVSVTLPHWRVLPAWAALSNAESIIVKETSLEGRNQARANRVLGNEKGNYGKQENRPLFAWAGLFLTAVWIAGTAFVGLRFVVGLLLLRGAVRKARCASDSLLIEQFERVCSELRLKGVALRIDDRRLVPFVYGILRPSLVLPPQAVEWRESELNAVLRHELAHIKRRDPLSLMVTHLSCALNWFNPVVWLAARELGIEREKACDDYVLTTELDPADYATQLVTASWFASESGLAALAMTRRSQLERRVQAALECECRRGGVSAVGHAVSFCLALAVIVPLALAQAKEKITDLGRGSGLLTEGSLRVPGERASTLRPKPTPLAQVMIEVKTNGTSCLTLDQFNLNEISGTLARIAAREPRSLVFIRHTGGANHADVVKVARLCRSAGLRCTFVSNFSANTAPHLPPEFEALPSKNRLLSLNVESTGKIALRAEGLLKPEILAALTDLKTQTARVVLGSKSAISEYADVRVAMRSLSGGQIQN